MEFTTHFGLHSQTTRLQGPLIETPTNLRLHPHGPFTLYGPSQVTLLITGLRVERHLREQT